MQRAKFPLLLAGILLSFQFSQAQNWVEKLQNPSENFYTVQQEFNNYWQGRSINKGEGYNVFRRYENFMEPRVYPSGDRSLPSQAAKVYADQIAANPAARISTSGSNWTSMGPFTVPANGGGAGRINFITIHPNSTNIIYAGSPGGGLWKTTNGGTSWTTNTDNLTLMGVSDLVIDPGNANTMYLATGDGDHWDKNASRGVLKSIDGGQTWNVTGLNWLPTQERRIRKLLMHPTNSSIIFAASNAGIWRTANAGASWTQVNTYDIFDIEFKPGNPAIVYAAGTAFYRSTNTGTSFTTVSAGMGTTPNRISLAVTPANANYVYLLAGKELNSSFQGLYRSTDSGLTFTTRSTTPNILGSNADGSSVKGQSWYDLTLAVSPTNADVLVTGGIDVWRSVNGGSNWTVNGHHGGSAAPYVHADIHEVEFFPNSGSTYLAACDGGVYKTTNSGTAWTDISSDLSIGEIYRIGQSANNENVIISGWQDNGTSKIVGTSWTKVRGADGMECFIDRTTNATMYSSSQYGGLARSTDSGTNWTDIQPAGTGDGAWITPWCMSPTSVSTLYAGYQQIYKSTNQGTSWSQLGSIPAGANFRALAVAPSNTSVIYAARYEEIYKTTNGGTTWTNITAGLPVASAYMSYITVHPTNSSMVWVTFLGFSSGNKVFASTNGGTTWTNISSGLPNMPVNCILFEKNSPNRLFVGTDVGVYLRDDLQSGWQPYMNGLPNVIVYELEIYYPTRKLRAATANRGLWQSPLPSTITVESQFTSSRRWICSGQSVTFTDQSLGSVTSRSWSFPGGTPSTSTALNPTVTYNTTGSHNVSLTTSNSTGSNTMTKTDYMSVFGSTALPLAEGFEGVTFAPSGWLINNPDEDLTWSRSTTAGGFGNSSACAKFANYSAFIPIQTGRRDQLRTGHLNLTSLPTATLTFDVAYARYSTTRSDTLSVLVSTNCGLTFTRLYMKGGSTLSTTGVNQTTAFTPTASQWRTEAVNLNFYTGQSSVIIAFENKSAYGNNLYIDNVKIITAPTASFTNSSGSICAGGSTTFTSQVTGSPATLSWSFPGGTPATSALANPSVTYASPGTYNATLTATNLAGTSSSTNYSVVVAAGTVAAPLLQGFDAPGLPPFNWNLVNPNNDITWSYYSGTGGFAASTTCIRIDNGNMFFMGRKDQLRMGRINLAGVANPVLRFDVAYARRSATYSDSLSVLVSTNCGQTWNRVYYKGGSTLSTTGVDQSAGFVPLSAQWRRETINLSGYAGQSNVIIAFENRSGWGNFVYLDNINIIFPPVAAFNSATNNKCAAGSVAFTNQSTNSPASYSWSFPGGSPATSTAMHPSVSYGAPGSYAVTLTVTNAAGSNSVTKSSFVNIASALSMPLSQNFENAAFAPSGWLVVNPNTDVTWARSAVASGFGSGTASAQMANFGSTGSGRTDQLRLGTLNFTGLTSVALAFDVAYARRSALLSDSLSVLVSTNCGQTFTRVYHKGGSTLSTTNTDLGTAFMPTSAQWRRENVDLSAFAGQGSILIAFENKSGNGNHLYLDNVGVAVPPVVNFSASPTTLCQGTSTVYSAQVSGSVTAYSWSFPGGIPATSTLANPTVQYPSAGTFAATLSATSNGIAGTITKQAYITVQSGPAITATASPATIVLGNSATLSASSTTAGLTFAWSGPGLASTPGASVSVTPAAAGTLTYTVSGSAATPCQPMPAYVVLLVTPPCTTPAVPAVSAGYICNGSGTATLTASGVAGAVYKWYNTSTATTPLHTGITYTTPVLTAARAYYVSASTSCGESVRKTATVYVTPAFTVASAPAAASIMAGSSVTLSASASIASVLFSWSPPAGLSKTSGTPVVAAPTVSTTYTLTGIRSNCTATSLVTVTVSSPRTLAAAENAGKLELQVWPVPVHRELTIQLTGGNESPVSMKLTNLLGRIVMEQQLPGDVKQHTVFLSETMPRGVYLLSLRQGLETTYQKIVRE